MQRYCKTSRIGVFLVYAYLWEVVIFKSRLTWLVPSAWAMHMVLSGIIPALIVLIGMNLPAPVVHPKIARIRALIMLTCSLIFFWSMISAMYQAEPLVEAAYAVMWFTMVLACWWASPRILNFVELKRVVFWQMLPIAACVVISAILFFLKQNYDPMTDRYAGVFYTSPAMSEAARLALIFAIGALIIYKQAHSTHILIIICAILCIILTRQRESYGQLVMLSLIMVLFNKGMNKFSYIIIYGAALFIMMLYYNTLNIDDKNTMLEFARLNNADSVHDLINERHTGYTNAQEAIVNNPLYGVGFTKRYSYYGARLGDRIQGINNIEVYSFDDDPHIALLTLGKSIGIPGIVLGLLLYMLVILVGVFAFVYYNGEISILIIGFAATAIMSSMFTNTLLSFGAINDRYLWVMIGVLSAGIGIDKRRYAKYC